MYQLYGLINENKFFQEFETLEDVYLGLENMKGLLLEAVAFRLFIVDPNGTEIQSVSK